MRYLSVVLAASLLPALARAAPPAAVPFDPSAIRLLDGPFHDNQVHDQTYLLSLDVDRLLSRFRSECGLKPNAPGYGGWEDSGVSGHSLGHYLSACALMYAGTGDDRFKQRVDTIVDQLAECQDHLGTGYVAGIPDWHNVWGNLKVRHGDMTGWVPWYTMHKELAGLRDAHLYCDSSKAKDVLVKLADWVGVTVAPLDDREMQTMLDTEQGGMAETLADVSAMTGDAKYMALAKRFTHRAITDPLAAGQDRLTGRHANTQVPKLIGAARIYDLTGDDYYGRASAFFWQTVVDRRTFATGGNGDSEHFFDPAAAGRHLSSSTAETCNVYNMLKLTRALYARDPRPQYADYAERATFNQILGSMDPRRGMVTYHQSLKPGGFKIYGEATTAFWCCTGTGMENHARYGDQIYFHSPDGAAERTLSVEQFIPSTVVWGDVTVRMQTRYPDDGTVKLTVTPQTPTEFTLRLRVPGWVTDPTAVRVDGVQATITSSDGAVSIKRTWSPGDTLTYTLPMKLRVEPLEGDPTRVAFLYGPTVLAADLGTELLEGVNFYEDGHNENKYYNYPGAGTPPTLVGTGDQLATQLQKVDGEPSTFHLTPTGGRELTLRPYARTHFVRYTVYFPTYATSADYDRHAAEVAAVAEAARRLAARTVDEVRPGEQQSEVDHHLESRDSRTGPHRDRHWRDAVSGGFFQYTVKTPPAGGQLAVTYWGDDAGRTFDVQIDGKTVATQTLDGSHAGEFFDAVYPLPAGARATVAVRFVPRDGSTAGGAFGVRTLRAE